MMTRTANDSSHAVWQISGGPVSRAYADVFLRHGVASIGPGDAGPWSPERVDDTFEDGVVRTDGIRYRMYAAARDFAPVAYANLTRLKQPATDLFTRMKRP